MKFPLLFLVLFLSGCVTAHSGHADPYLCALATALCMGFVIGLLVGVCLSRSRSQ